MPDDEGPTLWMCRCGIVVEGKDVLRRRNALGSWKRCRVWDGKDEGPQEQAKRQHGGEQTADGGDGRLVVIAISCMSRTGHLLPQRIFSAATLTTSPLPLDSADTHPGIALPPPIMLDFTSRPASVTKHLDSLSHPLPRQVSTLANIPHAVELQQMSSATSNSTGTGTTGTTLWLGAQLMAAYLAETLAFVQADQEPKRKIVELGGGVGYLA